MDPANDAERRDGAKGADLHTIYLAGGCFWGLEAFLKRLPGVRRTVAGYANGSTENPSYRDVCNWNTGHAETVAVTYDRRILPTDVLLDGCGVLAGLVLARAAIWAWTRLHGRAEERR